MDLPRCFVVTFADGLVASESRATHINVCNPIVVGKNKMTTLDANRGKTATKLLQSKTKIKNEAET